MVGVFTEINCDGMIGPPVVRLQRREEATPSKRRIGYVSTNYKFFGAVIQLGSLYRVSSIVQKVRWMIE